LQANAFRGHGLSLLDSKLVCGVFSTCFSRWKEKDQKQFGSFLCDEASEAMQEQLVFRRLSLQSLEVYFLSSKKYDLKSNWFAAGISYLYAIIRKANSTELLTGD